VHATARRNTFEIIRRLGGKALPPGGRLISMAFLLAVACPVPSNKGTNIYKGSNKRDINLTLDPVHPTARRNAFEIIRHLVGKALPTRGRLISKAFLLAVGCTGSKVKLRYKYIQM